MLARSLLSAGRSASRSVGPHSCRAIPSVGTAPFFPLPAAPGLLKPVKKPPLPFAPPAPAAPFVYFCDFDKPYPCAEEGAGAGMSQCIANDNGDDLWYMYYWLHTRLRGQSTTAWRVGYVPAVTSEGESAVKPVFDDSPVPLEPVAIDKLVIQSGQSVAYVCRDEDQLSLSFDEGAGEVQQQVAAVFLACVARMESFPGCDSGQDFAQREVSSAVSLLVSGNNIEEANWEAVINLLKTSERGRESLACLHWQLADEDSMFSSLCSTLAAPVNIKELICIANLPQQELMPEFLGPLTRG